MSVINQLQTLRADTMANSAYEDDSSKDKVTKYVKTCSFSKLKDLPWVEKYRPKMMTDIISHEEMIRSLGQYIKKKTLPHLLFFGPSGSGKTSTIMCCAAEIYGEYIDFMIMRLNASNERGIETVRSKIKNFVSGKNNIFLPKEKQDVFKLVILDEIDSMTVEAQGMLRQTIEKYSTTTRFCLICNEIDKINWALRSRCTDFRFAPLNPKNMRVRLEDICQIENISYEKGALEAVVNISNGDMRSAINLLQLVTINVKNKKITINDVYKISSHCHPIIFNKIIKQMVRVVEKTDKTTTAKISFADTVEVICGLMIDNNITIPNLLEEIKKYVIQSSLSIKDKIYILDNLARNEIYDSVSIDPKNIIMGIIGSFIIIADKGK